MDIQNFSKDYTIRKLTIDDKQIYYDLCINNPNYYKHCPPIVTIDTLLDDLKALPPNKTYDDKYFIGYFKDNELIAIMDFIDKYPDDKTAFIGFFMVNKYYQGKGIGTKIITDLTNYLKSLNYQNIRLGYVETNNEAKAFWLSNKFKNTPYKNITADYTVIVLNKEL